MNWKPLTSLDQVREIQANSAARPFLIFKHSTRCEISALVKYRLESNWPFAADELEIWLLDLLNYRSISSHLAEIFEVHHESPQILLIQNGECVLDASHLDISVDEIQESLELSPTVETVG